MPTLRGIKDSLTSVVSGKRSTNQQAVLDAISLVEDHKHESQQFRGSGKFGLSLEAEWERNGHRFLGNHHTVPRSTGMSEGFRVYHFVDSTEAAFGRKATINRTQNSTISNTANSAAQDAIIRFEPVETRIEVKYWLSPDGGQTLHDMVYGPLAELEAEREQRVDNAVEGAEFEDAAAADMEANERIDAHEAELNQTLGIGSNTFKETQLIGQFDAPDEPIDKKQSRLVRQLIENGLLESEDLIEIRDVERAKVTQNIWDYLWDRAGGGGKFLINELFCNIYGHQPLRLEWDLDKECFVLDNTPILNVWIDSSHKDIEDSEALVYDYMISLDRAKATLTDVSEEDLERHAATGPMHDTKVRRSSQWSTTDYQRKMLAITTGWIRYQDVPMTEREAMKSGKVVREPMLDEGGEHAENPETGRPAWRYFLAPTEPTGEAREVEPQTKTRHGTPWPNTTGIREIQYISGSQIIIFDRRCRYWDIPWGWNVNIPRPDNSPYGQGEPFRLEDISQQINRLMGILSWHIGYYQFPMIYWPSDVLERLEAGAVRFYARPGANVPLPRDDWQLVIAAGGFDKMTQTVPTLPSGYIDLFRILLEEHDNLSNNVGVRQGRTPFAGASGALVKELADQATGPLALKSVFSEITLRRIAKMGMHAAAQWLPESQIAKIVNRYSIPILRDIMDDMLDSEFNITVEIASGRGYNRQTDQLEARELYKESILTKRTVRERVGVDPESEAQREKEEQAEALAAQVQQVAEAQTQQPEPKPNQATA